MDHPKNTEHSPEAAATLEIPEASALRSLHLQKLVWSLPAVEACSIQEAKEALTSRPALAP